MSDAYPSNHTAIVSVTAVESAQQATPSGKNYLYIVSSTAFYIVFGGATVATPTSANGIPCSLVGYRYRFELSAGFNNFKVVRQTADGTLAWSIGST
jgi:hypothetical protein